MLVQFPNPQRIDLDFGISLIPCRYAWATYEGDDSESFDMSRADFVVIFNDKDHINHYMPFSSICCWGMATVINALCDANYIVDHDIMCPSALHNYFDYRVGVRYEYQQNDMFFGTLKRNLRGKIHALRMPTKDYNDFKRKLNRLIDNIGRNKSSIPMCGTYSDYAIARGKDIRHANPVH